MKKKEKANVKSPASLLVLFILGISTFLVLMTVKENDSGEGGSMH